MDARFTHVWNWLAARSIAALVGGSVGYLIPLAGFTLRLMIHHSELAVQNGTLLYAIVGGLSFLLSFGWSVRPSRIVVATTTVAIACFIAVYAVQDLPTPREAARVLRYGVFFVGLLGVPFAAAIVAGAAMRLVRQDGR